MDKTVAGLLVTISALVVARQAEALPAQQAGDAVLNASSYSALLRPVPNALATLRAMDAVAVDGDAAQAHAGSIVRVDDNGHHHHHPRPVRRRTHHHHHNNYER